MQISRKLSKVFLILGLAGATASVPAFADSVLYNGIGPGSYLTGAYAIDGPWSVTNSFTLSDASVIDGAMVGIFTGGSPLTTLTWEITSSPYGPALYSGTATSFTNTLISGDYMFFGSVGVYDESFSLANLSLAGGTYWLQLGDDTTTSNLTSPGSFWDISGGPSMGYETNATEGPGYWSTGGNTFEILGTTNSTTPEPSSLLLLGSGLAVLAGMTRRKLGLISAKMKGRSWRN